MRRQIARILRGLAGKLSPLKIPSDQIGVLVNAVFTGDHGIIISDGSVDVDPAIKRRCKFIKLE